MKKAATIIIFLFILLSLQAQDINYTQFTANKLSLNSAFVAIPGTSVYGIGRAQYLRIPNQQPFSFAKFNASGSTGIAHRTYIGVDIGSTTEGEGLLQNWKFAALVGYYLPLQKQGRDVNKSISFGVKGSYNRQQIDWSRLVFSDQLDPALGQITNVSPGAEVPQSTKKNYIDADVGILYQQSVGKHGFFEIGLNVQHLLRPDNSIQGLQATIPMHYTAHTSGSFVLNPNGHGLLLFLSPSIKADIQAQFRSFALGADLFFVPTTIAGSNISPIYNSFFTGLYFQNRNPIPIDAAGNTGSMCVVAGYKVKKKERSSVFAVSYDFNLSGLNQTNTYGSVELSAVFNFDNNLFSRNAKKPSQSREVPCNQLGTGGGGRR